jgi:Bax protein
MSKVISYRQKLIELARIYKIDRVFDQNFKHSTYDIEIILLKNKVPIPSRRGYVSHKFINEILKPFYENFKKVPKIHAPKYLKNFSGRLREKLNVKINFNISKYLKKFLNSIKDYFEFIVSNIVNFFKTLSKIIIESLNDIYNFKINEKIIKNIFLKTAYASVLVILVFSGFFIKDFITDVDALKTSLEIQSDKKVKDKESRKKVVKKQNNVKNNNSKETAKLPENKKTSLSDNDYNLNTQTVLNLFEDLEYDLDNVRNKKIVKPIYFTRLPKDLDKIRSSSQKKETFLQILLPLVVAENEKIKKDRTYLLKILKENQTAKNISWINKKHKEYKVTDKNIDELIEKIDIIPNSIALAQAAKESGWGTSRFALEGNAIFGQWTWNGVGMAPLDKDEDQKHKILKFPLLRASVKAYITNLNTHGGYKSFRKKRLELRANNKILSGLDLIHELENYAQTGKEYTKVLEKIIKQNDLDEFETVTIDDFKNKKQLKL